MVARSFVAGLDGPLRELLKRPRPAWVEAATAEAAGRLIAMQVAHPGSEAGGPIDILEIDASGAQWVGRDAKSLCARVP